MPSENTMTDKLSQQTDSKENEEEDLCWPKGTAKEWVIGRHVYELTRPSGWTRNDVFENFFYTQEGVQERKNGLQEDWAFCFIENEVLLNSKNNYSGLPFTKSNKTLSDGCNILNMLKETTTRKNEIIKDIMKIEEK